MAVDLDVFKALADHAGIPGDVAATLTMPDPDDVLRRWGARGVQALDCLFSDSKVFSVCEVRQSATTEKNWMWSSGQADNTDLRDALRKTLTQKVMYEVMDESLDSPMYGAIPVEIVWKRQGMYPDIDTLLPHPPEFIKFNHAGQVLIAKTGKPPIYGKLVVFRFKPRKKNPYGRRILSRLLWPVTFKKAGIKYWAKFLKKYGIPKTLAWLPNDRYDKEKDEARMELEDMTEDAVGVLREKTEVEAKLAGTNDSGEIFRNYVAHWNAEIAETVLGQPLTTSMPERGTQALGTVQYQVEGRIARADERMVAHGFSEVGAIYASITSPGSTPPTWEVDGGIDYKAMAELDLNLSQMGVQFSRQYIAERYNIAVEHIADMRMRTGAAFASATEQRGAIDRFVREQVSHASDATDAQIETLLGYLRGARSYEDVEDALIESLGDDLSGGDFSQIAEQAMVAAHLYGRASVREGLGQ